jgi:glycerophosphoryl diester phosphodiesterase
MISLPKIIGHRGAAGYAPENTLIAIHTAADMGCEWVELDIKLTKDGVAIIFHDETLERTTNGAGKVCDFLLKDIRDLEAGSYFGESFAGEPIPTLEEALEAIIERGLGFNLEFKPCPSREIETVEAALDVMSTYWDDHDRLLLSSFNIQCLEHACEMAPEWARGYLMDTDFPESWREIANHLKVETLNVNGNTITEEQVQILRSYGKPLLAYTINEEDRADWLFKKGIQAIFSDMPDLI